MRGNYVELLLNINSSTKMGGNSADWITTKLLIFGLEALGEVSGNLWELG